jgi:hypothetical protein
MLGLHSLNIKQSPISHWLPPKMPPRFLLNTELTFSVNAPEAHEITHLSILVDTESYKG